MRFWICCGYYASIGLLFFIIGRILPKKWFDYNAFPYKAFDCEKDGKIYEKIAISKWQSSGRLIGLVISPLRDILCLLWERSGTGIADSNALV